MAIQSIGGQNPAYLPGYTAQGAASGMTATVPASAPDNPAPQPADIPQTPPRPLEDAVAQVQNQLRSFGTGLNFSIDKESEKIIVKVIDPTTQKLIRQIPSKEMLAIARSLDARDDRKPLGLLISQKV